MIKGIYTSATAMRQGILRQELTANNLANAGTTGYKRDRLFTEELEAAASQLAAIDQAATETRPWTEFNSGSFDPTGNSLDFALQGAGFFVLADGQQELYSRSGHFERTADGLLVDALGRKVQGEGGDIMLPAGTVSLAADGRLSVDGAVIDRLRVVGFEDPQALQKAAGSAFRVPEGAAPATPVDAPTVRQGFLESSNVDVVREMVEMISTSRHYEVNARLITTQDESLRHVVGDLGRV